MALSGKEAFFHHKQIKCGFCLFSLVFGSRTINSLWPKKKISINIFFGHVATCRLGSWADESKPNNYGSANG